MPPKKHLPKEELERLVRQGYKLTHLAEHFGCDISTVKARLEEYGIPFEIKFSEKIEIPKDEIVKRIRQGKTYRDIAKEFGVSYGTIKSRAKEYGINYWEERVPKDVLRRLAKRGMTVPEMAKYFNVSQSTIENRLKKYRIKLKTKRDTTPLKLSRDLLYKWYIEEGMSAIEIANELGVSDSSVYHYLKKYNIPRRHREEREDDPTKEEIVELYYGKNLNIRETAKALKIGTVRLADLMRKYGIQPKPKARKKYTDEEILEELRKAAERYGRAPMMKELRYDEEFRIDVKTVVRRFGSWERALRLMEKRAKKL
ncbi:helix-turn-helix domain-containing protein [Geoglobus ahangari]